MAHIGGIIMQVSLRFSFPSFNGIVVITGVERLWGKDFQIL